MVAPPPVSQHLNPIPTPAAPEPVGKARLIKAAVGGAQRVTASRPRLIPPKHGQLPQHTLPLLIVTARPAQAGLKAVTEGKTAPASAGRAAGLKRLVRVAVVRAGHKVAPACPKAGLAAAAAATLRGPQRPVLSLQPAQAAMVVTNKDVAQIARTKSAQNALELAAP